LTLRDAARFGLILGTPSDPQTIGPTVRARCWRPALSARPLIRLSCVPP